MGVARSLQQNPVLVAKPISSSDPFLAPTTLVFAGKSPRLHDLDRLREHRPFVRELQPFGKGPSSLALRRVRPFCSEGFLARFSHSVRRRSAASRRASSGVGMRPSRIVTAANATASFLLLAAPRIKPTPSPMYQCWRSGNHSTDAQCMRSRETWPRLPAVHETEIFPWRHGTNANSYCSMMIHLRSVMSYSPGGVGCPSSQLLFAQATVIRAEAS